MTLRLYNSLTKQKEDFVPLNPPVVKMYTCGVTVYDLCHIGHARSLYVFDVIRRYLKYRGFEVRFVRNITDVDDKIIARANELGKSSQDVSEANIAAYYQDMEALGVSRADIEPKATDNILEMVGHIKGLIDNGFAYESNGDVYFDVRKFTTYGKLSGQSIDQMLEGVRIDISVRPKVAVGGDCVASLVVGVDLDRVAAGAFRRQLELRLAVRSERDALAGRLEVLHVLAVPELGP